MPSVVYGSHDSKTRSDFSKVKYEYDYPDGRDFRPNDELHDEICDSVMNKAVASHNVISQRFPSWRSIDQFLTGYIPADEEEQNVQDEDSRKPVSIVFPYTYAVLDTLLTYLTMAFVQDPVFEYEGNSPEDAVGSALMEKVVQKHVKKNKVPLALHTMWRDSLAYGIGPVAPGWNVRRGTRNIMRGEGEFSATGRLIGREPETTEQEDILFEGNELFNIDPYNILPDPNVSIDDLQEGEFFGWLEETSVTQLLNRERDDPDYFNVRYLRHMKHLKAGLEDGQAARQEISDDPIPGETSRTEVVHMYVDLIPEDWELGDDEYPSKWLFSVAGGQVLIRAKPLGLNHGMYPVAVSAPDTDGRSIAPTSKLETLYGLQHILNFLFNSHVTNVRKAINDMFVVDPYLINMNDLKDPEPGKLVRMRRPGWGKGVKDAVSQLGVTDVTRGNVSDSSWILNWMNNISGADESMMGSLREGGPERLTAAEFKGTRGSGMSRLEHMSRLIGYQAMQDIGYFFASHAQQLMSRESYVKVTGRWQELLSKHYGVTEGDQMKVRPEQLLIDYDVNVKDGSVPGSSDAGTFMELFKVMADHPELQQNMDVTRVFRHIARESGVKNVDDFMRKQQPQPQQAGVMDDEKLQREVEKGNLRQASGQ